MIFWKRIKAATRPSLTARLLELMQISISWRSHTHVWLPSIIWILSKLYKWSISLSIRLCLLLLYYYIQDTPWVFNADTLCIVTLLKFSVAGFHMATQIHILTRTHMPFPITHIIPVIPVPWLPLVQSRVGRKKVELSGCTFSSSAHMTAVPSDITAAEERGSYRQWSTEGLWASSGMPDSVIKSHRLGSVWSSATKLHCCPYNNTIWVTCDLHWKT